MSNIGVIQEQGDYGNFSPLNDKDRRAYQEQAQKSSGGNKPVEDVRLGDCSHLDRK